MQRSANGYADKGDVTLLLIRLGTFTVLCHKALVYLILVISSHCLSICRHFTSRECLPKEVTPSMHPTYSKTGVGIKMIVEHFSIKPYIVGFY